MTKTVKTEEERRKERDVLEKQLHDLGITEKVGGFLEIKKRLDEFVTDGYGWTGKVKIEDTGRRAEVVLATKTTTPSSIVLRFIR